MNQQFGPLAAHYDELMHAVPYEDWADYVRVLWSFAGHSPRRVLDCACGTGNLTFELAKLGLDVVGVDLAPEMIRVAREKSYIIGVPARFEVGDLGDFDLGETFDSASCLYDSLNYIVDPDHLKRAFECIGKHLEPGGVFVFDMNSVFALKADLFTQTNRADRRPLTYEWRAHYDAQSRLCTVKMRFEQQDAGGVAVFEETHVERAYELDEVRQMLRETGWDLEHEFDAYTLNRPHDKSERWFFVARKT